MMSITNEPSCNTVISTNGILFITCMTDACAVFHYICPPELTHILKFGHIDIVNGSLSKMHGKDA